MSIRNRIAYLRQTLRNECLSYNEMIELWELAKAGMLDGDMELLEAAGVPEFPGEPCHA